MPADLLAARSQSKAREAEERRAQERRRSTLVLVLRHLCDSGYIESYERLAREANLDLSKARSLRRCRCGCWGAAPARAPRLERALQLLGRKSGVCCMRCCADGRLCLAAAQVDVADNVDLVSIVQEYEEGFEARYGRRPKLVRHVKEQVRAGGWQGRW
jgi:katanin p60 ATPase-containing subunit A1